MLKNIDEKCGFKGLKAVICQSFTQTYIELWQIKNNDDKRLLGKLTISKESIRAESIIATLLTKYKGIMDDQMPFMKYVEIVIMKYPREAFDWIISTVMMHQLANC